MELTSTPAPRPDDVRKYLVERLAHFYELEIRDAVEQLIEEATSDDQ